MNTLTIDEARDLAERIVGFELKADYVDRGDREGVKFYPDSVRPDPPAMEIYFEEGTLLLAESKVIKVSEGMVDGMKRDGIYEEFS